ncbi:hypothetical protein C4K18_1522 [Pseudomonas chlororaphis subsp. aurantiaca]|nr:hypothetical protein C4K18_1522 [Pseudomonas chlororaphis subsp. aurantiaca]
MAVTRQKRQSPEPVRGEELMCCRLSTKRTEKTPGKRPLS